MYLEFLILACTIYILAPHKQKRVSIPTKGTHLLYTQRHDETVGC